MPLVQELFLFLIEYIGVQSLVFLVKQLPQLLVICFNRIWLSFNELNLLTTCLLIGGNLLYLLGQVRPYVLRCDYIVVDEQGREHEQRIRNYFFCICFVIDVL